MPRTDHDAVALKETLVFEDHITKKTVLDGIQGQRDPLSSLSREKLEEVRNRVLAVDVWTGELLWHASSLEELKVLQPAEYADREWGVAFGPNPRARGVK